MLGCAAGTRRAGAAETRPIDAYRTLHVHPEAEDIVIQAAYRALARRYHPDGPRPDPQRMVAINQAYAQIRTPDVRREYDAERRQPPKAQTVIVTPNRFDPWARSAGGQAAKSPPGATVLDFGRYAGWRLGEIARRDPDYLRWLARHTSGFRYRNEIRELVPQAPEPEVATRVRARR